MSLYWGNKKVSLYLGDKRVRLSIGAPGSILPAGYTQVEYIQSTGLQRINTELTGPARWVITAQSVAADNSTYVLITGTPSAAAGSWLGAVNAKWSLGGGKVASFASTTKATADLTFNSTGSTGTVNGETLTRSATVNIGAWTMFRTASGADNWKGRVFEAIVYQNDVMVAHMLPARRDSDGVLGLYDVVRNIFLTNTGDGIFTDGTNTASLAMLRMNKTQIMEHISEAE